MDPERVTPEHLVAIAHHQEAFEVLAMVYEIADEVIRRGRPAPPPEHSDSYGTHEKLQTWWSHSPTVAATYALTNWELGWMVFRDSAVLFPDGKPGVPRITAGASAPWGTLETLPSSVKEQLAEARFQLIGRGDLSGNTAERIWRLVYPRTFSRAHL